MCVRHVTSDQNGNLYAVTESGELLHNRHANGDPQEPLIFPGSGRRIAAGFDRIQHVISWGAQTESHLGLITSDGTMFYNWVENPQSAAPQPALPGIGSRVATGWGNVRNVFCDQTGVVYSLLPSGELFENQLIVTTNGSGNHARLQQPALGKPLVSGWTGIRYVFSAGRGRFLSIDLQGVLRYSELSLEASSEATVARQGAWERWATGWGTLAAVFGAGGGAMYAITIEGNLLYSRLRLDGLRPPSIPPGHGALVGYVFVCPESSSLVEGYCWPLSVAPGKTIEFKVSVRHGKGAPRKVKYRVRYLRLRDRVDGHTDIPDDLAMGPDSHQVAELQDVGKTPWRDGCNWKTSFKLTIPRDGTWRSGLYAAECSPDGPNSSERQPYYVLFVVNPSAGEPGDLAVLSNINTWNAYNCWGGTSKYHCREGSPLPRRLSFVRPNVSCAIEFETRGDPDVRPAHLARGELWVLSWLERNHYPFHVYSDHDLDRGIEGISKGSWFYRALILNTHPEYWTIRMHKHLTRYLSRGGSLIYLGGNGLFEEVTYTLRGRAMQVLERAPRFYLATCNGPCARLPCQFRYTGRPESAVLGVGFLEWPWPNSDAPYQVMAPAHPLLAGVVDHMIGGDGLCHAGASTWEIDVCDKAPPLGTTVLARGTNAPDYPFGAHMVYRELDHIKKNFVFSVGSLGFPPSFVVDRNLQQIVRNVLATLPR
jgi:hypothetical protein